MPTARSTARAQALTTRIATVLAAALALLSGAGPAHADPAGPTNYATTITRISPQVPGWSLEVFGGDAFLVMSVEPGVEALVYGYEHDEARGIIDPYLRFSADGTVEVNRRSPARWLNEDRYAAVEEPSFVDPNAPPDWELVATDGTWAWHDHRIHWMSPDLPRTVDPAGGVQRVFPDERPVPLRVDGQDVEAFIVLEWQPGASPLPWGLLALVVGGLVVVAGRRPSLAPVAVLAAGTFALVVSVAGAVDVPPGVGRAVPPLLLPPVAIAAALVAVRASRPDEDRRAVLLALAALPLLGWAVVQFGALTAPLVPSAAPVVAIRAAVGVTAGTAVAILLLAAGRLFAGDLSSLADLADESTA